MPIQIYGVNYTFIDITFHFALMSFFRLGKLCSYIHSIMGAILCRMADKWSKYLGCILWRFYKRKQFDTNNWANDEIYEFHDWHR